MTTKTKLVIGERLLTNWMLGKYQRKILQVFFNNPNVSFSLRQLGRLAEIDPGNTKRYVEKFVSMDLLSEEKNGRRKIISPNYSKPLIGKVFEIMEVSRSWDLLEKNWGFVNLKEVSYFLADILKGIDNLLFICFYGFHLDGNPEKKRLNLLAVETSGQTSLKELKQAIDGICKDYAVPFQIMPIVINSQTFEESIKNKPDFLQSFWKDRVVLHGESYLWRTIVRLGVLIEAKD